MKTFSWFGVFHIVWIILVDGCGNRMDPATADREARALLGDAPFFNWEVDSNSRLAAPSGNQFPLSPPTTRMPARLLCEFRRQMLMKTETNRLSWKAKNGGRRCPCSKTVRFFWIWKLR